ncbi:MAG: tRNA epoxyqueuosine(34) reductase QueG [Deltaproteobacteria bacterium]|nr:tRNA epoxyqueuosine(34) reductase QueG [Deltaproteobacteria bacterium]MBI3293873.1 tRNA epoxyqueuosine(34) reductase QueG [Deltaproteobacteria bacterium]
MLRELIEEKALGEGLLFLGNVSPDYPLAGHRYGAWIDEGLHAGMDFLARNRQVRGHPVELLPGVRSVSLFAMPYGAPQANLGPQAAQYARHPDYHKVLKKKLERIAGALSWNPYRVFVDSAPLLERALAEKTTKGFIGKNTCYIHPRFGSLLLLGEIFSTIDGTFDVPSSITLGKRDEAGGCGSCTACQVSCPTGALDTDYRIDSAKCLAYWTIENRGTIPVKYWPYLAQYWFGCDICQNVCPFNTHAVALPEVPYFPVREVPDLLTVATMGEADYQKYFGGTPFTRAKRAGLRRNALIALVVTKHPELDSVLATVQSDPLYPLSETVAQIDQYRFEFPDDTCVNIPHATPFCAPHSP